MTRPTRLPNKAFIFNPQLVTQTYTTCCQSPTNYPKIPFADSQNCSSPKPFWFGSQVSRTKPRHRVGTFRCACCSPSVQGLHEPLASSLGLGSCPCGFRGKTQKPAIGARDARRLSCGCVWGGWGKHKLGGSICREGDMK